MDIWKYLPAKLKKSREAKKVIARQKIHGEMVDVLYRQRDAAEKEAGEKGGRVDELETKVNELQSSLDRASEERDKYKDAGEMVYAAHEEREKARDEVLADILLGPTSKIPTEYVLPDWLSEAIIRKAKEHRENDHRSQEIIKQKEKERFSRDVSLVGGVESISRIPLIVYDNGEIIYQTKASDKMIGSQYKLREEINNNKNLIRSLKKGKKAVFKYGGGRLHFIPEKLKNKDYVAIAYFVPGREYFKEKRKDYDPKKQKKRTKAFAKFGENGARAIYKTLKSHDRQGLDLI